MLDLPMRRASVVNTLHPWHVVLSALLIYLTIVLVAHRGDPLAFVRLGFGPNQGYDGQFTYLIATNPRPAAVAYEIGDIRADVPAYRYQRILLPLLARIIGAADPGLIAWAIPLINVAAHTLGTSCVAALLTHLNVNRWHALVFGLWPGLLLATRANLAEPLSYALVAAAYLWYLRGRAWLSTASFGLAVFAKETALLFAAAHAASALLRRQWSVAAAQVLFVALPFALWQLALKMMFGEFGVGSGGYLATSFEFIPFNGMLRVAHDDVRLFFVFLLVLGPSVILPSVWGLARSLRECLRGNWHPYVLALAAHAGMMPFTPFSTFREPGAMLRLSTGLVLTVLLFAGLTRSDRALAWTWYWLALLVFLR